MNIIFAGTPAFSAVSLKSLVDAGYSVPLVVTQPDRRSGRGMSVSQSQVKEMALGLGIETYQPISLKSPEVLGKLESVNADLMIVVAFGQIVPKPILSAFRFWCINVHASLLPRWRGAAPIQRAIMAGDEETGVCIMRMAEGLDTGPVFLERRIPINDEDTSGTLHNKLAYLGAEALIQSLSTLGDDNLPVAQESIHVTYAHKILFHKFNKFSSYSFKFNFFDLLKIIFFLKTFKIILVSLLLFTGKRNPVLNNFIISFGP